MRRASPERSAVELANQTVRLVRCVSCSRASGSRSSSGPVKVATRDSAVVDEITSNHAIIHNSKQKDSV